MFISFAFLFLINVLATPIDHAVALRVSCRIIDPSILNCLRHRRRSPNEHDASSRSAQWV
jgi:hypothetical protein